MVASEWLRAVANMFLKAKLEELFWYSLSLVLHLQGLAATHKKCRRHHAAAHKMVHGSGDLAWAFVAAWALMGIYRMQTVPDKAAGLLGLGIGDVHWGYVLTHSHVREGGWHGATNQVVI